MTTDEPTSTVGTCDKCGKQLSDLQQFTVDSDKADAGGSSSATPKKTPHAHRSNQKPITIRICSGCLSRRITFVRGLSRAALTGIIVVLGLLLAAGLKSGIEVVKWVSVVLFAPPIFLLGMLSMTPAAGAGSDQVIGEKLAVKLARGHHSQEGYDSFLPPDDQPRAPGETQNQPAEESPASLGQVRCESCEQSFIGKVLADGGCPLCGQPVRLTEDTEA